MVTKKSISYDDELEDVIQDQIEAGVASNRSEWIQDAAYIRLALQQLSREARGAGTFDPEDLPEAFDIQGVDP